MRAVMPGAAALTLVIMAAAASALAPQPVVYSLDHHEIEGFAVECITVVLPAPPDAPAPALVIMSEFEGTIDGHEMAFERLTWYTEDSTTALCDFEGDGMVSIVGVGTGAGVPSLAI